MNINETVRIHSRRLRVITTGALLAGALVAAPARAIDVLGFYVGAGVGQAELRGENPSISAQSFKDNHSAWKAVVGVRPISLLGAEIAYMDLGSVRETIGAANLSADLKGTAAYGLLYLPLPLPFLDIYGKAGYARLTGTLTTTVNACAAIVPAPSGCNFTPGRIDLDDDGVAAGAGAQFKLGSWAIRGEYERFLVSGSDPSLLSLSVTKTFF